MLILQEAKGKGKRPAKRSKVGDDEPKSKKAKKESSEEGEDSDEDNKGEVETDFSCAATDK